MTPTKEICEAVLNEGQSPYFHRMMMRNIYHQAPVLAAAISNLVVEQHPDMKHHAAVLCLRGMFDEVINGHIRTVEWEKRPMASYLPEDEDSE